MKQTITNYQQLLYLLRSICPLKWHILYESFEFLDLRLRKAGIAIFRCRHIPTDSSSTLFRITQPFIDWVGSISTDDDLKDALHELVENPDLCAISLSILLSATYEKATIVSMYKDMLFKEINALESEARPPTITWSNLLSLEAPLSSDFRPAPSVNRFFRGMIERWKSKLSSTIIYPHSSTKSLSRDTLRQYNDLTGNSFESISPLQLEQYYCGTGIKVGGVCEMRQVWYPTIATPRTYYAMGGDAYFKSRYLRDVFNYLGDYLPATNRHTRVEPSHLNVESDEDTFIYDLTSFTSMFHEQRYFLDFIADCVDGLEVQLFDSYSGIVPADLGDLIREYNTLNKQPEYSLERVMDMRVLRHSVAGFLGVYANLITCTIPHGIILMTLTDSKMKQWCAGDDAGTLYKRDDAWFEVDCDNTLRSCGSYAPDKCFRDNERDPALALKRQLIRLPRLLALQPNILFPPFCTLFEHDSRFSQFDELSYTDRLAKFCSGLSSMMYQMSLSQWEVADVSFLRTLLPHLYTRFNLPPEGWFPPLCGYGSSNGQFDSPFLVPRILGDFWKMDPTKALLDAYMPKFFSGRLYAEQDWDGIVSDEFVCNPSRVLRFATKMGFLDCEDLRYTYQLEDEVKESVYREYLKSEQNNSLVLCRFVRIDEPPVWLC